MTGKLGFGFYIKMEGVSDVLFTTRATIRHNLIFFISSSFPSCVASTVGTLINFSLQECPIYAWKLKAEPEGFNTANKAWGCNRIIRWD